MISQAVLSLILALTTPLSTPGEAKGAFVDLGFDEARALAKQEDKLLMIDFFTTWCGPCKKLDAVTWPDARVQRWLLENVIAIKIDADQDARTKSLYEVDLYPSLVFTTPDGLELGRFKGFLSPEKFLGSARMLVAASQDGSALALRATSTEQLVPRTRLDYANYLAGNKRYREAATHYLWCFDEGAKHDSNFGPTKRGEVLDNLLLLSRTWIRGKRELRSRRDATMQNVLSEEGTPENARDLAALDAILESKSDTLATYIRLTETKTEAGLAKARVLLDSIFDQLIGPKRYSDIMACAPDFSTNLDVKLRRFDQLNAEFKGVERATSMLAWERSAIVNRATLYFEVRLASEQPELAEALGERLVKLDTTARTFLALARRAKRTGDRETALAWANRGLASVPEEQTASLAVMKQGLERELKNANR